MLPTIVSVLAALLSLWAFGLVVVQGASNAETMMISDEYSLAPAILARAIVHANSQEIIVQKVHRPWVMSLNAGSPRSAAKSLVQTKPNFPTNSSNGDNSLNSFADDSTSLNDSTAS